MKSSMGMTLSVLLVVGWVLLSGTFSNFGDYQKKLAKIKSDMSQLRQCQDKVAKLPKGAFDESKYNFIDLLIEIENRARFLNIPVHVQMNVSKSGGPLYEPDQVWPGLVHARATAVYGQAQSLQQNMLLLRFWQDVGLKYPVQVNKINLEGKKFSVDIKFYTKMESV